MRGINMDKLVIKHNGDLAHVESVLEKAVISTQLSREAPKELSSPILLYYMDKTNLIYNSIINHMIDELSEAIFNMRGE
jgi:hypothetical protein